MAALIRSVLGKNSSNITRLCASSNRFSPFTAPASERLISSSSKGDEVTHTGQKFEEGDQSLMRFDITGKTKLVNPEWAINLVNEAPPIASKSRVVSCDGGGGPLGHPKVFINLDQPGNHACGYCGLRFYKEDHH